MEGDRMNEELLEEVRSKMPMEDDLLEVAELFKVFGDLTRVKIICALSKSELCVSDLTELLEMNQSAVSHQLRLLKQSRLVKTRRDGKVRFYSLADEHIQEIFKVAFEHILEE
ncbi:MAG TPA: helix-turn-helix transcriptional regulator [Candidatus Onthocola gallistercoris]|uniref:Helix-turn-helix transcriptional regulator n=1 Tax=Candidatus Onthocola gallistercoris TaxID=2840876 RepID=A0A9D1HGX7_9FIRM|nr:helix-turn-helix transcriptional regulator [Candidatus Onthocola gallistercoris]